MKTRIVRIGNSRGIYLPKAFIEQVGLGDEVELEIRNGAVVISPAEPEIEDRAESEASDSSRGDSAAARKAPTGLLPGEWVL